MRFHDWRGGNAALSRQFLSVVTNIERIVHKAAISQRLPMLVKFLFSWLPVSRAPLINGPARTRPLLANLDRTMGPLSGNEKC
jgi:hypothetical protein